MKTKLFSIPPKDLNWETFRAGGKGGQKQNKTESAARVTHVPSGATAESREERSQHQNKRIALGRLVKMPAFVAWVRMNATAMAQGYQDIEAKVNEAMRDFNIQEESDSTCIKGEHFCDKRDGVAP